MENEIKTWLTDIKQAIDEINSFMPEKKDFFLFQKNLMAKRAIERNVEIIGEAVKRILVKYPEIKITKARKIVDTRNRISHAYDSISDDVIWTIVIRDLPTLENEINTLLEQ